jgi:hypothetical protein
MPSLPGEDLDFDVEGQMECKGLDKDTIFGNMLGASEVSRLGLLEQKRTLVRYNLDALKLALHCIEDLADTKGTVLDEDLVLEFEGVQERLLKLVGPPDIEESADSDDDMDVNVETTPAPPLSFSGTSAPSQSMKRKSSQVADRAYAEQGIRKVPTQKSSKRKVGMGIVCKFSFSDSRLRRRANIELLFAECGITCEFCSVYTYCARTDELTLNFDP